MSNPARVSTFALLTVGIVAIATASCGGSAPSDTPASDAAPTIQPTPSATPSTAPPAAAVPDTTAPDTVTAQPPQTATATPPRPNPVIAGKRDCGALETQADMNQCAGQNYQLSDDKLNEVYQYVRSNLNEAGKAQLTQAEQAWIDFRDAQCEFEQSRFEGGSIAPMIFASCMEQLTDIRIDELDSPDLPEQAYSQADQQLNQVYQDLQAAAPEGAGDQLREVQLDWLKYRDANCAFEADFSETVISETQCLARMTETRTNQLRAQLEQWSL